MNTEKQNARPITISGVRRPNWICRNVRQKVILVRDASESMTGQKAKDASAASLDLVAELAQPENKDGFSIAVVDFAEKSRVAHDLENATALNGKVAHLSIGPLGIRTNITSSLEDAFSILEKAQKTQESAAYLRPVVLIFTDGCHNEGPKPFDAATRLKDITDLVTVAFGSDADETLMRSLATSPQHFYRCSSGRELRTFLASVGATLTATMAARTNATHALTMLPQ